MFNSPLQVGQQVRYRWPFETQYCSSAIAERIEGERGRVLARLADGTICYTETLSPVSAPLA